MTIRKSTQNVEIGVVWRISYHSRSSVTQPIDGAHTTISYSILTEIVHLSCTVFDLQPVIRQKSPILIQQPAFGIPVRGETFEFLRDLSRQKTRAPELSNGVVSLILSFSRFTRTLTYDRQTDTRRRHLPHYSIASRGKKN